MRQENINLNQDDFEIFCDLKRDDDFDAIVMY